MVGVIVSAEVTSKKKYYVYELVDPRDGAVFYVGKGCGNRIRRHVASARRGVVDNAEKFRRISEIHADGMHVIERIHSWHESEDAAFLCERNLIKSLRGSLTNIVGGVVTNEQRAKQYAQWALDRMESFDAWMRHAKPYQVEAATKLKGSPLACYESIRDELRQIAELC